MTPFELDPIDRLAAAVENLRAGYAPNVGKGYTQFQGQGRQIAGPTGVWTVPQAGSLTITPRPDTAWVEVRGNLFSASWDGGKTWLQFPDGSFIPAGDRMTIRDDGSSTTIGTALTVIGWDLLAGNVRAVAASNGAMGLAADNRRVLLASGTDAQGLGTQGLVALSGLVATEGYRQLVLELNCSALVNNGVTSLLWGLTAFDAAGNPIWGTAVAGFAATPLNTSPSARFTTITAPFQVYVITGAGLPVVTDGGGATGFAFTSRAQPVPAQVIVHRFTSGGTGLTSLTATWSLYGVM